MFASQTSFWDWAMGTDKAFKKWMARRATEGVDEEEGDESKA